MHTIKRWCKNILYLIVLALLILLNSYLVFHLFVYPSNQRIWNQDQVILPFAKINGDEVSIYNIRNFDYASTTSFKARYYDKTYDINKLKRVWYMVEPFSGIPGSAHTLLSFEFEDNTFLAISVEIRKEQGESFHPFKGLFNQYEIMYVVADERDVIKLRSNFRKDDVYLYPVKADKEKIQALFIDMINRVNKLKDKPEFYNTLANTCTTNIVKHINTVSPSKVPFYDLRILFPANSDILAYELGLIDTDLSFEEARKKFYINERAMKYADDENFSVRIRE